VMLPTMNIVVSNVRGPDLPIYLAGAQMVAFAPVSIALDGLGLNVTGFSYHGTMWVCSVGCREMMPDPGFFADCMREAFSELVAAANALPEGGGGPRTAAARTSGRAPTTSSRSKGRPAGSRSKRSRADRPAAAAATPSGKKPATTVQRTKSARQARGKASVRP